MSRHTVLLVGLGHLGGVVLELLARDSAVGRIVACSRRRERGEARCNLARLGSLAQGREPHVDYLQLDLAERDRLAETIHRLAPDLILHTASMQTWWLTELLPEAAAEPLRRARFGLWLACHLAPCLLLMDAVVAADFRGPVLTAPFPDVVNCILGRLGRAPTSGVGNVDEIANKLRLVAAARLRAEPEAVEVLLVAHHALEPAAFGGRVGEIPPYFARVLHRGRALGGELDVDELLLTPYPLPAGAAWAFLTAGSTLRLIRALLGEVEILLHAPGPHGLPGGYPVRVGGGRIEAAAVDGLTLEEAIAINERSHPFDGIERIEPDGTAVLVDETAEIARRELGYDCPRLVPSEAALCGAELVARFREYAGRHGVDLDRML